MKVKIINQKGLHARASAKLAELAETFDAEIQIEFQDMSVDARSIMGLMMLGAANGSQIEINATGPQSQVAEEAIKSLIDDYFGEGN